MLRRPPRSTLFPTRRSSDLPDHMGFRALRVINDDVVEPGQGFGEHPHRDAEIFSYVLEGELQRSEEHTSELQSPVHLVCRLLLEKKKKDERLRLMEKVVKLL